MQKPDPTSRIVFFDGICILCNRTVDFLISKDRKKKLKFASLQSDIAMEIIPPELFNGKDMNTVIFNDQGRYYTRSAAILKVLGHLPFPYNMSVVFMIVPPFLRDRIYHIISVKRYQWFGKQETCRMPDKETAGRIIE
jgi:predicted DCC family thiol-disulfide oxidoreductase YuxK